MILDFQSQRRAFGVTVQQPCSRHISLAHLYVQELTTTKQVIGKVKGDSNPADCLTKYLPTGKAVKKGQERLIRVRKVLMKQISASRLNIRQFSSVIHKL